MPDTYRLIHLMLKIILILVFNDSAIIRFLWGCFFLSIFLYILKLKQNYIFKMKDLLLSSYLMTGAVILTYIISFICLLFINKLNNIGKEVDLKEIVVMLKTFVMMNTWFMIYSTSFLVMSFVMLFVLLLQIIKNYIYIHFMRLDLWLINNYPLGPLRLINPSSYDKFKSYFIDFLDNILKIAYLIQYLFPKSTRNTIRRYLYNYKSYYGLILLLIFFVYDILYNNMILFKFYYALPFVFCYQLLLIISRFRVLTDDEENILCLVLYHQLLYFDVDNNTYVYKNNYSFTIDDMNEVMILLECNFNRNLSLKIIHEKRQQELQ